MDAAYNNITRSNSASDLFQYSRDSNKRGPGFAMVPNTAEVPVPGETHPSLKKSDEGARTRLAVNSLNQKERAQVNAVLGKGNWEEKRLIPPKLWGIVVAINRNKEQMIESVIFWEERDFSYQGKTQVIKLMEDQIPLNTKTRLQEGNSTVHEFEPLPSNLSPTIELAEGDETGLGPRQHKKLKTENSLQSFQQMSLAVSAMHVSLCTPVEIATLVKQLFEPRFHQLAHCDDHRTEHPNRDFMFYELNLEHRFMAAVLDSLDKILKAHSISVTPENVDTYLKPVLLECVNASSSHILENFAAHDIPTGLKALLANPDVYQPKAQATAAILAHVAERIKMKPEHAWRLIVEPKKLHLLEQRGIADNPLLMHLFDAERDYSFCFAKGWEHMLADLDSGEPYSMTMARKWHATCTGKDGSVPSSFAPDQSCPVVESISATPKGMKALRARLVKLNTDYGIPSEILKNEETRDKTQRMGKEFFYVNREDTSMRHMELFAQRLEADYLSRIAKLENDKRQRADPNAKRDNLQLEDIDYIQYNETAHLFPDANGRVWGVLFLNFARLKRGETVTMPYEPYVIDASWPKEVMKEYRDGEERFRQFQ